MAATLRRTGTTNFVPDKVVVKHFLNALRLICSFNFDQSILKVMNLLPAKSDRL